MKKSSLASDTKILREGLPKSLALEKCVKVYAIKVQPSLYAILKQYTPSQVRQILIQNLNGRRQRHKHE